MSSRGRGSWRAFRSDGRLLGFGPSNNRPRDVSTAVEKPDKTTRCEAVRRYWRARGTIMRTRQSFCKLHCCGSIVDPWRNSWFLTLFYPENEMLHFQKLAEDGSHSNFNWSCHRPTLAIPRRSQAWAPLVL
jgi:hypothetical protein